MLEFSEISRLAKKFDAKIERCLTHSNPLLNDARSNLIDMALSRHTLFSGHNYDLGPTVEARCRLMELYLEHSDEEFTRKADHYPLADLFIRHWMFDVPPVTDADKVARLAKEKIELVYQDDRISDITSL